MVPSGPERSPLIGDVPVGQIRPVVPVTQLLIDICGSSPLRPAGKPDEVVGFLSEGFSERVDAVLFPLARAKPGS